MIKKRPYFSICIPAYKRVKNIDRLLKSIVVQTFDDFEIIITDDSPDDGLQPVLQKYKHLPITYVKNTPALGTPANWNTAIGRARGKWIKLMHDDDCFATKNALAAFKNTIDQNPKTNFFFSAYVNVHEMSNKRQIVRVNQMFFKIIVRHPATLLARNIVGPPSVTLYKNDRQIAYDENVKWVVDMEFYIRYFNVFKPVYINNVLIEVGINEMQVTNYTFGKADVQLRENLYLLNKMGYGYLKNIFVFDAWWRMLRNFKITSSAQLAKFANLESVPKIFERIIKFQSYFPSGLLHVGLVSKIFMVSCFLMVYRKIPK